MGRIAGLVFSSICVLTLSACGTWPTIITSEDLMEVHEGMRSEEILSRFGEPKAVNNSTCGMPPNQWSCTTWEYGEYPYDEASFTFREESGSLILNNYNMKRN